MRGGWICTRPGVLRPCLPWRGYPCPSISPSPFPSCRLIGTSPVGLCPGRSGSSDKGQGGWTYDRHVQYCTYLLLPTYLPIYVVLLLVWDAQAETCRFYDESTKLRARARFDLRPGSGPACFRSAARCRKRRSSTLQCSLWQVRY